MRSGFGDMFTEANAGTDAVVRSATEVGEDELTERGLIDAGVVDDLVGADGVAAAVPWVEGTGQIVGADGDPLGGNGPPTVAANWVSDTTISPWRITDGRAPEAPAEVVIDRSSADNGDLAAGDTTTVRVPEPIEVTVVGIATFGDADSAGPATYAAFTTDYARDVLLPSADQIPGVLLAADEGVSQSELVDRLAPALPDGAEALTGAQLTAEQEDEIEGDFLGFFEAFLLVFAGIALVVATFSIYNTFSILVAQKTRESALLRALGASRRQVLVSTVGEALLVGVVASAMGLAAGVALASGLMALMDSAGFGLPSSSLVIDAGSVITAMVVGVVVTLLASVAPAVRASRVAPLAALRDVAIDRSGASPWRGLGGPLVVGAGGALAVLGTSGDGSLPSTRLGAPLVVPRMVLLGPVVARPAAGVLGLLGGHRGLSGKLARRNAMRNPRRTAGTASALMVGVAVVTLFTVVGASIKQSVDDTVSQQFAGDLVIAQSDFSGAGLSPELGSAVAQLPPGDAATGRGNAPMVVDGEDYVASVIEPEPLDRLLDLEVSQGSLVELGDREVALHDEYAEDHGLALGDPVPVGFADGTTDSLDVGAIFGNDELMGEVVLPRASWVPHSAASEVDQLLRIIYVLLVMAIVIALMGIANTLSLSIHERTRELGLLRAVGQSRRQLRSMVRAISAAEGRGSFTRPAGQLAVVLALGALVGIVAAVRPARRAAKLDVLQAIATD